MKPVKVYFLSGLGADERMFRLLDLSFCEPVFIPWIAPLPKETLEAYAFRLRRCIPDPHPAITGLSFGGMLATEMAKADPLAKVVIISSAKTRAELPAWIRAGRYLPIYKWLPGRLLRGIVRHNRWVFGPTQPATRQLLHSILKDSNMRFDTWAVEAIVRWQNQVIPANVLHIHGDTDCLLPYSKVQCQHTIGGGRHLMVMDHAQKVSTLLRQYFTPTLQ